MLLPAFVTACGTDRPETATEIRVRHLPPSETDIIEAVIRTHDVSLNVHWSCYNVGDFDDRTIGRYIGRLISFGKQGEANWVEVTVVPRRAPTGMYWRATVMFHIALDKEWLSSYGAEFLVRQRDGAVIPSSFSCPGH